MRKAYSSATLSGWLILYVGLSVILLSDDGLHL
jgi:hypothetical protein